MEYFFYLCLFVFGTLFGSFSSVLIYRLKSGEGWIWNGRSHCTKCENILKAIDLIPIVSWVVNKAKCKYCKSKVSSLYPILEISTGFVFTLIGIFLIDFSLIAQFQLLEIFKMLFWLSIWFISILYIFYDIMFLEIHEGILMTGISIAWVWLALQTLFSSIQLIPFLPSGVEHIWVWISSIIMSIVVIWILYIIMLKEFHEWVDIILLWLIGMILFAFKTITEIEFSQIAILSGIIWVLIIFIFFFLQIVVSRWAWMWWGDLRIAILVWLLLGMHSIFPWLMLTYFAGSIIGVGYIIYEKIRHKWAKLDSRIPFGPFLAIWFFLTVFYNTEITNLISIYF